MAAARGGENAQVGVEAGVALGGAVGRHGGAQGGASAADQALIDWPRAARVGAGHLRRANDAQRACASGGPVDDERVEDVERRTDGQSRWRKQHLIVKPPA